MMARGARKPADGGPGTPGSVALPPFPCYLNHALLSADDRWLLRKIGRFVVGELELHRLLAVDPTRVARHPHHGQRAHACLLDLRARIHDCVTSRDAGSGCRLVVVARPRFIEWPELDAALATDLERFLEWIRGEHPDWADVFASRFGIGRRMEKLGEVGDRRGVTRERVRQIEVKALAALRLRLREHPTVIRPQIEALGAFEVEHRLETLRAKFEARRGFTAYVEACVGVKRGKLFDPDPRLPSSTTLLGDSFAGHAGAASHAECVAALQAQHGLRRDVAEAYVSELVQRGDLVQTDQGWVPRNLTLPQAVAHVLADRPEGLSWQTILALIDERGLRRRDTHLDRLATYDSRWVRGGRCRSALLAADRARRGLAESAPPRRAVARAGRRRLRLDRAGPRHAPPESGPSATARLSFALRMPESVVERDGAAAAPSQSRVLRTPLR